jgi:PBP1b-binding outer membrane lipoprotein LpoB
MGKVGKWGVIVGGIATGFILGGCFAPSTPSPTSPSPSATPQPTEPVKSKPVEVKPDRDISPVVPPHYKIETWKKQKIEIHLRRNPAVESGK